MLPDHRVIACGVLLFSTSALGYKEYTHALASQAALEQSLVSTDAAVLRELGLGEGPRDPHHTLPLLWDDFPVPLRFTPAALIFQGSIDEDSGTRSFNHFMDTQQEDIPLTVPTGALGLASSEWALERERDAAFQHYSYKDAKEYLRGALTGATHAQRELDLGAAFYALGHVVHLVQDMAQPQHVRNDDHCENVACKVMFAHKPSAYEQFTFERGRDLTLNGYPAADSATFATPAEFWRDSGQGIGEFTSSNFVSIGTNFYMERGFVVAEDRHPNPTGVGANLVKRQITDPDLLGPRGPNQPLAGEIWFVGTRVVDHYRGVEAFNERASTFSIFANDLEEAGQRLVFTLNRFNYAAANEFLLPRAAAYSTGLINYFFRGRIGIELPEEGVYGIIDHATTNAAGQGFDKVKLRLSNTSPDGEKPSGEKVPQIMQGGTLVAVAKYTLNGCYTPDLAGDFAVDIATGAVIHPACSLGQYFAGDEQISQSAAILAASLEKTPGAFTFDFSSQPIPVNARDLRIQVVYTGQLGAEADGIAFGGRDISEPTHLMIYNNSDYYAVDGTFYTPQQIRSDAALSKRVQGLDFDPAALTGVTLAVVRDKPLTDASDPVPVNGYVRAVVLADIDQPFSLNVRSGFARGGTVDSTFAGIWANTTDLRGEQAFITPLAIYRRPRTHFVDVVFKANNAVPLGDNELTAMSARDAGDPGPTRTPVRY